MSGVSVLAREQARELWRGGSFDLDFALAGMRCNTGTICVVIGKRAK